MSEIENTYIPPHELPADTLVTYEQFAPALPGLTRDWVYKASRDGRFVPGVRPSERKPMLFKAGAVAAWIANLTAPLEAGQ